MNQSSNRLWILGPPLSLCLLVAALYIKKPDARDFIDRKCPWVKETVGKYAPPFEVRIVGVPPVAPPTPEQVASAEAPKIDGTSTPPPFTQPPRTPRQEPKIPTVVADSFDFNKVCQDPARWPKSVRLKTAVDFPAVLDGRVVGKLLAPSGAEARVIKISNGKVGVEYQGGGAWLAFESTDFVERARLNWH